MNTIRLNAIRGPSDEQFDLWDRISSFPMDNPKAELKFSDRLAYLNGWTAEYAQQAINEYLKFIFLCAVSKQMVTPSLAVDSVWHLHLLYTRSYQELCNIAGRFIHHEPSTGGEAETKKFKNIYEQTLALYASYFDAPPSNVWGKYNPQQDPHTPDSR